MKAILRTRDLDEEWARRDPGKVQRRIGVKLFANIEGGIEDETWFTSIQLKVCRLPNQEGETEDSDG
jgi:hypothetical protein